MEMIVPEMIFISGDNGATAQIGKGDPEAFRKLMCEMAGQVITNIQKEPRVDCEGMMEVALCSAWIEIPHLLAKEHMDADVALEDIEDCTKTSSLGSACEITAELPAETTEPQIVVGKSSVPSLP